MVSITVAIVGLGISGPVAWSMPSLIAPRGHVGAVAGLMNFGGALGAIAAPITAGYLVNATHDFEYVFIAAIVALIVGMLSYALLLGKIEQIGDGEPAGILI
jgi:ACS family D-galactonate transporter-like MFS transporter